MPPASASKTSLADNESAIRHALAVLTTHAHQQLDLDSSQAFELWMAAVDAADAPRALAHSMFVSEAAFAATARIALEFVLGADVCDRHRDAFPHLFSSPLFGWFEPDQSLRDAVLHAIDQVSQDEPVELLGWLYQFTITDEARKRFGQFYTPQTVVCGMLDNVGYTGDAILRGRILDPACGAGAYLIEATRRILAQAHTRGLSAAQACRSVAAAVHGLDRNPLGVLLAEAAIALLLAPSILDAGDDLHLEPLHLYVCDTLRYAPVAGELHADAAEDLKRRRGAYRDGFEFVVANPPYGKLSLRDLTDDQRVHFSSILYGQPNLYALFVHVGVDLLSAGGRMAFITPRSWVSGLHFGPLRRYVADRVSVQRLDTFNKRSGLFDGVLQEVIILTAQQGRQRARVQLREFAGAPVPPPAKQCTVPASSVIYDGAFGGAWLTCADEVAHRAADRMRRVGTPLGDLGFDAYTGTIVWNRLKEQVRDEAGPDALPLIWGNGIRPFRFQALGNRVGQGTHMAVMDRTRNIISRGDALLLKRMTAKEERRRIVACRVPDHLARSQRGWFAENHVNVIRAVDAPISLDALLGLLNSRLFDYVFRAFNGSTQVSANELQTLPVVTGDRLAQIAYLASSLRAGGGTDARARLDELVYDLYGIDAGDRAVIDASFDR